LVEALKPLGFFLLFVLAIGLQCWLYSLGYGRWAVVLVVLLILAGLCAWESWRLFIAFVAAMPVGALVIAGGFEFWLWLASHTGYFNDKGSGPLGVLLFSVVPGVIAFGITFGLATWLVGYRPRQGAKKQSLPRNKNGPEYADRPSIFPATDEVDDDRV
jgi:hypothetical protein